MVNKKQTTKKTIARTRKDKRTINIPEGCVAIMPVDILNGNCKNALAGRGINLNEDMIREAGEMSKLGCKNKDIYNSLEISERLFNKYMSEGRLLRNYVELQQANLSEQGVDPNEFILADAIEILDDKGDRKLIYNANLKLQFLQTIEKGRADGNKSDLKHIDNAKEKDWKAAAYTLEKRSPDLYKNPELTDQSKTMIVQNNTLIQNIHQLSRELEEQDKQLGINKNEDILEGEILENPKK